MWWRSEEVHSLEERTGATKANLGKRRRLRAAEEASCAAKVLSASYSRAPRGARESTRAREIEKLHCVDRRRLIASMRFVPR